MSPSRRAGDARPVKKWNFKLIPIDNESGWSFMLGSCQPSTPFPPICHACSCSEETKGPISETGPALSPEHLSPRKSRHRRGTKDRKARMIYLLTARFRAGFGKNCVDSWVCVLHIRSVFGADPPKASRHLCKPPALSKVLDRDDWSQHFAPSFSFDRFICAVFSAVGGVAVLATAAFGNEVDYMPDHLVTDRYEMSPSVNDCSRLFAAR